MVKCQAIVQERFANVWFTAVLGLRRVLLPECTWQCTAAPTAHGGTIKRSTTSRGGAQRPRQPMEEQPRKAHHVRAPTMRGCSQERCVCRWPAPGGEELGGLALALRSCQAAACCAPHDASSLFRLREHHCSRFHTSEPSIAAHTQPPPAAAPAASSQRASEQYRNR